MAASLLLVPVAVAAQVPARQAPSELPTNESLQERLRQLESAANLDDAAKAAIRELVQQTQRDLDAISRWTAAAEKHRQSAEAASTDTAQARRDVQNMRARPPPIPPADLSVPELRERLASREGELPALRTAAAAAEQEPKRRTSRRQRISQLLAELPSQLAAAQQQIEAATPAEESRELTIARRDYLENHLRAIRQQVETLQAERAAYDATVDLLPLRRRLASMEVDRAEEEISQLRDVIGHLQRADVERQLQVAEQALSNADEAARPTLEDAIRLAKQRLDVRGRLDLVSRQHDEVRAKSDRLRSEEQRVRDQIQQAGLTNAIGQLLRRHRIELLPDERALRDQIANRQDEIRALQQAMFELEDQQRRLELRSEVPRSAETSFEDYSATPLAEELRLQYLDLLATDTQTYFYKLVDLDSAEREMLAASQQYARFVDENALWIRGAAVFELADLRHAGDGLASLLSLDSWRMVGKTLGDDARRQPTLTVVATAVFLLLIYYNGRANKLVIQLGERADRSTAQQFAPTLLTLVLTVLSTLPWPALMAYLGWRLGVASPSRDFRHALAMALWQTAVPFFLLLLARQVCRAKGLAGAHFGWTSTDLAPLRRWLRLLMIVSLPLIFVVSMFNAFEHPLWRYSAGRAALALVGLVVMIFAHTLLRPARGLLFRVSSAARSGWIWGARYALYLPAVLLPVLVTGMAVTGYYVAAIRLAERAMFSVALLFGLLLLGSLMFRWALVTRRWLAIRQERERRASQRPENSAPRLAGADAVAAGSQGDAIAPPAGTSAAETQLDIVQITGQTRRFLWAVVLAASVFGLWTIWSDILPALSILERVELWQNTVSTTETIETATGAVITRAIPQVEAVTLADCVVVFFLAVLTVVGARNLPGLMELGVWQRLPLDAGSRFAISAATRYLIYIVGILVVSNTLGFAWSKVGWLVAALTVGLGFGLQEIFANFVSGLIVLAERPVRVGDLVTIGNINGTVSRIQMRATTIRDWNHRELVVPNKKLVTENLINWTLTDTNYRVDLVIGIAYGSDTEKAREILLKIAAGHPKVLDKPRPKAIFRAFGSSSLEIEFRIYIPHMDFWPRVVTEVNTAIASQFRAAGIVIAYPQQDIHIRSIEAALPLARTRQVGSDAEPQQVEP